MGIERVRVILHGVVQGVGFRPFVHHLATSLDLHGWVRNSAAGLALEVEGPRPALDNFLDRLEKERPPLAFLQSMETTFLEPAGHGAFAILPSSTSGARTALILPDIAPCPGCLREIFDPADRRYRYPFTNCTHCGPRFSIIESLPYDRANTSMGRFAMCPSCESEYHDPRDRRFHAQPTACPECGPQLQGWDHAGRVLSERDDALRAAAVELRAGRIVALKGIGGFQLLADARNEDAVLRLRLRKHREEKPFAVMFPALDAVRRSCHVTPQEERLLASAEAPIVLLERLAGTPPDAPSAPVAPRNPFLGVMLPSSPLHHLLLRDLDFPLVATSGNLGDEPICIDEHEALRRLEGMADFFLVHNRPIVRHIDDSIARVILDRVQVLRRARGYAPLPVQVPHPLPSILALGAHLKNTVTLASGTSVFISQHIGDLETGPAYAAFQRTAADLPRLYDTEPGTVAHDLHPGYLSTQFALGLNAPHAPVQHHYAHVLSCMADNDLQPPVLGVAWDGTGLGNDGTLWGGEFLLVDNTSFTRAAHLLPFRLPGGDAAIKQPCRSALGALFEIHGKSLLQYPDAAPFREFTPKELALLSGMLERGVQSPLTSSAGRLFDAVASLAGLRQRCSFEGQAAMELEFAATPGIADAYPFRLGDGHPSPVDWRPALESILHDTREGTPPGVISAKFHNTLAEMILAVARRIGEPRVVLTGGCFQNRTLTVLCANRLEAAGFRPFLHQRVPPNDGGISLGQVLAAAR